MPCWEVRTVSVEFKADNRALLNAAIEELGWRHQVASNGEVIINGGDITLDLVRERATVRDSQQAALNQLKQAYSRQAVKSAAKRFNWACKMQGNNATVTKMNW